MRIYIIKLNFSLFILLFLCSCGAKINGHKNVGPGEYVYNKKNSYSQLILQPDGYYTIIRKKSPMVEHCNYSSKGKWRRLEKNLIELTSEDNYTKQQGYDYTLVKENKGSQDSLYFKVNFPKNFEPYCYFSLMFNNKSFTLDCDRPIFSIPKSKYLWPTVPTNVITFAIDANTSGTELYRSRVYFEIFKQRINTDSYNSFIITLPNFDLCFFEFEPYKNELLYLKNDDSIIWKGIEWIKE